MSYYTMTYHDSQGVEHAKKMHEPERVRDALEQAFWNNTLWVMDLKQYAIKRLTISIQPGETGERSIDVLVEYKGVSIDAYIDC